MQASGWRPGARSKGITTSAAAATAASTSSSVEPPPNDTGVKGEGGPIMSSNDDVLLSCEGREEGSGAAAAGGGDAASLREVCQSWNAALRRRVTRRKDWLVSGCNHLLHRSTRVPAACRRMCPATGAGGRVWDRSSSRGTAMLCVTTQDKLTCALISPAGLILRNP
jgi:hypothetical protein